MLSASPHPLTEAERLRLPAKLEGLHFTKWLESQRARPAQNIAMGAGDDVRFLALPPQSGPAEIHPSETLTRCLRGGRFCL